MLLIIGLGVYGYFTTPLPFGLSSYIRTPGGAAGEPPGVPAATGPGGAGARARLGQVLQLGDLQIEVGAIRSAQAVTPGAGETLPGSYTLLDVAARSTAPAPVALAESDFTLVDDAGRSYSLDAEATRAASAQAKLRSPVGQPLEPGEARTFVLAFQTPPDAKGFVLRVAIGYGEISLQP